MENVYAVGMMGVSLVRLRFVILKRIRRVCEQLVERLSVMWRMLLFMKTSLGEGVKVNLNMELDSCTHMMIRHLPNRHHQV